MRSRSERAMKLAKLRAQRQKAERAVQGAKTDLETATHQLDIKRSQIRHKLGPRKSIYYK
jgi:hypothetical protein